MRTSISLKNWGVLSDIVTLVTRGAKKREPKMNVEKCKSRIATCGKNKNYRAEIKRKDGFEGRNPMREGFLA